MKRWRTRIVKVKLFLRLSPVDVSKRRPSPASWASWASWLVGWLSSSSGGPDVVVASVERWCNLITQVNWLIPWLQSKYNSWSFLHPVYIYFSKVVNILHYNDYHPFVGMGKRKEGHGSASELFLMLYKAFRNLGYFWLLKKIFNRWYPFDTPRKI